MASLAQQLGGLKCPPHSATRLTKKAYSEYRKSNSVKIVSAMRISNAQTRERERLKDLFDNAYERCRTSPMEGVEFNIKDFHNAIEKYVFNSEIGTKVKGTVFNTDGYGAFVDITAKSSAYLPLEEVSIYPVRDVEEAGIVPGMTDEFVIIGENEIDDSLILSLWSIQYDLAWEQCRQLQSEDVVVKGTVVGANKGGLVALVEGLSGFVPFSQISTQNVEAEELLEKDIPLKFVEVDEV